VKLIHDKYQPTFDKLTEQAENIRAMAAQLKMDMDMLEVTVDTKVEYRID
jgi:hypothetical protein